MTASVKNLNSHSIHVHDSDSALVEALAAHFAELSEKHIAENGFFTVSLSGGSTPKALYERLAAAPYDRSIEWSRVRLFLGDERCVAHNDKESNYLMIKTALLDRVPVPEESIFATHGQDKDPAEAAKQYEETIKKAVAEKNGLPMFDLILLGLGPDGHTASLFPESQALGEKNRLYVANFVEKFNSWRLTMTYPLIDNGREILFLVAGDSKANILKEVLCQPEKNYPSQRVRPTHGKLGFYIDSAAAKLLDLK